MKTFTNLPKKLESYQRGYKDGAQNKPSTESIGIPAPPCFEEYQRGREDGQQDYARRMQACRARLTQ